MNVHSLAAYHEANHIPIPLKFPPIQSNASVEYIDFLTRFSQLVFDYASYFPEEKEKFMNAFYEEGNATVRVVKTRHQLPKEQSVFKAMKSLLEYHTIQKETEEAMPPSFFLRNLREETNKAGSADHPIKNDSCRLPSDIWTLIFGYACTSWQDVGRLSLISRSFYEIATGTHFLRSFFERCTRAFDEIKQPPLALKIIAHTQFKPSRLPRKTSLSEQELLFLTTHGSNLENLSLQGGDFSVRGLAHLLQQCPLLKALEFHHNASTNFDDYLTVVALYAPQLERLAIIDCQLTDQALLAFSICKHRLRSFECWNSSGEGLLTDCGFSTFISQSEHLEAVKLTGFPQVSQLPLLLLEAYTSDEKQKSESIKELTFAYCGLCDEGLFEAIASSFSNLEALEIGLSPANCSKDDSTLTKQRAFMAITQACPHLRLVKLSNCHDLGSKAIEQFLSHGTAIEHLELYRSNACTPSFFSAVANLSHLKNFQFEPIKQSMIPPSFQIDFQHLESFGLNQCLIEEDQLMEALKKATEPKLKLLRLFNCGHFSNRLLEALGASCPELTGLEIEQISSTGKHSSLPLLNDAGIQALSTGCQKLETLNLKSSSPSWQFSDDSLAALSNCRNLALLTLSHFETSLSERSLNTIDLFNRRCMHIAHLGFPFSHFVDDSIIPLFAKNAQQLRSVDLKLVSGKIDLLKDLVLTCPNLQVLEIDHAHMRKVFIHKLQKLSQLTIIYTSRLSSQTSNPSLPSLPTSFSAWARAALK